VDTAFRPDLLQRSRFEGSFAVGRAAVADG